MSIVTAKPAAGGSTLGPVPELAGRVADAFEEDVRRHEEQWLSPLAVRSYETRGRVRQEDECRLRTPFQRDRDRILHSKSFRRLKGKTQVFIDPAGDHYRTRMTHTLETTGIARGVARALRLNEDLVEAIGLGHDVGHPPFGHAGEEALDAALQERFGRRFRHNEQSLRIAESLNLTAEVREGILTHTGGRRGTPKTQGQSPPRDARRKDRPDRRPRRVHQPRHRRRGPLRDSGP
jgi:dGTPase